MTTSTNGTPATGAIDWSGWSWRVDPPEGWLVIPSIVTESAQDVAAWELEATALVRESLEPQPDGSDEPVELDDAARAEIDQLATDSVANLRAFADGMAPDGHRVVAVLGVMEHGPVPVLVAVNVSSPDEPDEGLMAALGATGGDPAMQPNVEFLDLPDGDGVRVTRLDIGELSGGVWMSISVGRRTEHEGAVVDTVLVWRTMDILLAAAMVELLDNLLSTVQITRVET